MHLVLFTKKTAKNNFVAQWQFPVGGKVCVVEFEHGSISGKRVIRVDNKVIKQVDYMFELVGTEHFVIGKHPCKIVIANSSAFSYSYTLYINNKSLEKFIDQQDILIKCWLVDLQGKEYKVVLEKNTMDIYVDGQKTEIAGEFGENGTNNYFQIGNNSCVLMVESSGQRCHGMIYTLLVNDLPVSEINKDTYLEWAAKIRK